METVAKVKVPTSIRVPTDNNSREMRWATFDLKFVAISDMCLEIREFPIEWKFNGKKGSITWICTSWLVIVDGKTYSVKVTWEIDSLSKKACRPRVFVDNVGPFAQDEYVKYIDTSPKIRAIANTILNLWWDRALFQVLLDSANWGVRVPKGTDNAQGFFELSNLSGLAKLQGAAIDVDDKVLTDDLRINLFAGDICRGLGIGRGEVAIPPMTTQII